jgi:arylsulfatase B
MTLRKISIALVCVTVLIFALFYYFLGDIRSKPNVVIIVADDMGWADVGYHSNRVRTPNIDTLASEGIELNRFYVAPTCTPTRAGLLTGKYPIRFGMAQSALAPYRRFGLPEGEITLAEALATQGYIDRGAFGKWHLGHLEPKWHPLAQGFTHFEGHYNGAIDYFNHSFQGERDWHLNYEPLTKKGYSTDLIANSAIDFIEKNAKKDSPYFTYVAFNSPHTPLQAKEQDLEKFHSAKGKATKESLIAAMIWNLDENIGKILKAIDRTGESENTIVWFLSDNGGTTGIVENNTPLKGHKRGVFEGGIRVPSAVRWPDRWPGGRKLDDTVGYIDLFATINGSVESENDDVQNLPSDQDGLDLGELFKGSIHKLPDRDWYSYIGQDHPKYEWLAIKSGEWKLIVYGPTLGKTGLSSSHMVALYDIESDPEEQYDLTPKHPRRIRELSRKLAHYRNLQPPESISHYNFGSERHFDPPTDWRISP